MLREPWEAEPSTEVTEQISLEVTEHGGDMGVKEVKTRTTKTGPGHGGGKGRGKKEDRDQDEVEGHETGGKGGQQKGG